MRRREFITLIAGAVVEGWPLAARAQQPMPVIGYLSAGTPDIFASRVRSFREGLSGQGYVEGRNVAVEYRWTGDNYDDLQAAAADLVGRNHSSLASHSSRASFSQTHSFRKPPLQRASEKRYYPLQHEVPNGRTICLTASTM
jgi:putative ABC transport system substrate-binding protein